MTDQIKNVDENPDYILEDIDGENTEEDRVETESLDPAHLPKEPVKPEQEKTGILSRLSIRVKQHGLLAMLVTSVIIAMGFLFFEIAKIRSAIAEQAEVLTTLEVLQQASKKFGDMSYWYTDLTNSLSDASEQAAAKAQEDFISTVGNLATLVPGDIEKLITNADGIGEIAMNALDEYALEERANGNLLMDQARILIKDSDSRIKTLVEQTQNEARTAAQTVAAQTRTAMVVAGTSLVIVLAIGAIMAILSERLVINPLGKITITIKQLADGEKNVTIPFTHNKDEIGDVATALLVFQTNAQKFEQMRINEEEKRREHEAVERMREEEERERERQEQERIAEDTKRQAERATLMEALIKAFDEKISNELQVLSRAAVDMDTTADSLVNTVSAAKEQTAGVSKSADETTQRVQTVAKATEEMTASIGDITRQSQQAMNVAKAAVETSEKTNQSVSQLQETASKIGEVVELINSIAEQTNLLALNATIESARAGDAGKGFAVVAGEVKTLANQTAGATDEISSQIKDMVGAIENTVESIGTIHNVIDEVNQIATGISAAVQQQNSVTAEISESVQGAATLTQNISQKISSLAESSNTTGTSASDVKTASDKLAKLSETLNSEIHDFLEKIKAA